MLTTFLSEFTTQSNTACQHTVRRSSTRSNSLQLNTALVERQATTAVNRTETENGGQNGGVTKKNKILKINRIGLIVTCCLVFVTKASFISFNHGFWHTIELWDEDIVTLVMTDKTPRQDRLPRWPVMTPPSADCDQTERTKNCRNICDCYWLLAYSGVYINTPLTTDLPLQTVAHHLRHE